MSELDAYGMLMSTLDDLEEVSLKVKAQRDEAVNLLRESLMYSATGSQGPFKSRVKQFLDGLKNGS